MFYLAFKNAAEKNINYIFKAQSLLSFSSDYILVMKQEKKKKDTLFLCAKANKMLLFEVMVEPGHFVHKINKSERWVPLLFNLAQWMRLTYAKWI